MTDRPLTPEREQEIRDATNPWRISPGDVGDLLAEIGRLRADLATAREALRENVGDAYLLLTQGELPNQRRQPSAQRIYDRSREALDRISEQ